MVRGTYLTASFPAKTSQEVRINNAPRSTFWAGTQVVHGWLHARHNRTCTSTQPQSTFFAFLLERPTCFHHHHHHYNRNISRLQTPPPLHLSNRFDRNFWINDRRLLELHHPPVQHPLHTVAHNRYYGATSCYQHIGSDCELLDTAISPFAQRSTKTLRHQCGRCCSHSTSALLLHNLHLCCGAPCRHSSVVPASSESAHHTTYTWLQDT